MKKLRYFCTLLLMAVVSVAWAQTSVTWSGANALPGTATSIENDENITIMVSSTNTYSDPIRVYANTTVTINALNGAKITSITYEASSTGNFVNNAQNATVTPNVTPTVDGKNVKWTFDEADDVTEFTFKPSAQTRSSGITVVYTKSSGDAPSITASNVDIAYDATGGEIAYTLENEVAGGSMNVTTTSNWLSITSPSTSSPIAFSCSANGGAERTATVTLTYTYGNESVTKNVTVTQTGDPNRPGTENNPYSVAEAIQAIDDANQGTVSDVFVAGIVSQVDSYNNGVITYWISDDGTTNNQFEVYRGKNIGGANFASQNDVKVGDEVVVKGNITYYANDGIYEFAANNQLVSLNRPVSTTPIIEVSQTTVNVGVEGDKGILTVQYQNIDDVVADIQFYDATGAPVDANSYEVWLTASLDNDNNVNYIAIENNGEARTAYFKVYALVGNDYVYSGMITITQEAYVAPSYATLPFSFNSGRSDIENTDGLTQSGLGSDYNSAPKLKFDGSGDQLQLQFDEEPGKLSFDIKGNNFSGGTFKVQTSEDGVTFTDLETFTELGDVVTKTYDLDANVRYVKWTYTNKVSGNVALGNIVLEQPTALIPTVVVAPTSVNVAAAGGESTIMVTCENMGENLDYSVFFCNADGSSPVDYDWIDADFDNDNNIYYVIGENTATEARTAYLKVIVADTDAKTVAYSDVITITQAAPVVKYIVSFELDGGTFVGNNDFDGDIVEKEVGTYTLPSATKDGYKFNGWNDGKITYAAGANYEVASEVSFTAQWVEKGAEEWVLTSIADLTADDVFVIVGNNGSNYAMTNDKGTSAPAVVSVTIEDDKITSEVDENLMWNIGSNATDGYTFFVNGDDSKWLYCTSANNGVRVGSNENNVFIISDEGYLENVATSRNVGIYNSQDWRCYLRNNGDIHSNITGQTFSFYKKVVPSTTVTIPIKEDFTATTFSCDKALDFTGLNITAYIITDGEGSTTSVTKVPAGEGLYIVGAAGDYKVPVLTDESEADDMAGNLLVGTISEPVNTKTLKGNFTYYLFGKLNGKEAFFKVGENTSDAKATASAGKAYLAVPGAGNAKEMIVIGGDVTGIESIENGTIVNDNYYTIDGKLVKGQPTQKGIYVVNGRKVVIK